MNLSKKLFITAIAGMVFIGQTDVYAMQRRNNNAGQKRSHDESESANNANQSAGDGSNAANGSIVSGARLQGSTPSSVTRGARKEMTLLGLLNKIEDKVKELEAAHAITQKAGDSFEASAKNERRIENELKDLRRQHDVEAKKVEVTNEQANKAVAERTLQALLPIPPQPKVEMYRSLWTLYLYQHSRTVQQKN